MPVYRFIECFVCGCILSDEDVVIERRYTDMNDAGKVFEVVEYYCPWCYEGGVVEDKSSEDWEKWEKWKQKHLELK